MRAEFNAFKAALSEPAQLAGKVDTSVRVTTAGEAVRTNYVIAFPAAVGYDDERYTASQRFGSTRMCEFDVRFVAVDADGVLILAEAAMKHLLNLTLTVPGRVCDPIWVDRGVQSERVKFDRTARLFYLDVTYEFKSRSAA